MKDEIKPLEAPAVAYMNTSMAEQMHDFFTCKRERDEESRNRQKKEALVRLLVEKFENLLQVDYAQAVHQGESRSAISRGPGAVACHACTCHMVACLLARVHECASFQTLSLIGQMVYWDLTGLTF